MGLSILNMVKASFAALYDHQMHEMDLTADAFELDDAQLHHQEGCIIDSSNKQDLDRYEWA